MHAVRKAFRASVAIAIALALASCQDGTAPQDPGAVTDWSHDITVGDVLGGTAAFDALESLIERLRRDGRSHEIPEAAYLVLAGVRAAEQPALMDLVPSPQPSFYALDEGVSGPFVYGGVTYYEKNGILYPPVGERVRIINPYTTGVLQPGSAEVNAGFEFVAHDGTQDMSWSITDPTTGTVHRSATHKPFGSREGGTFATIKRFSGHLKINDLPQCNIRLSASTNHSAWNVGGWTVTGITVNGVPVVGITIVPTPGEKGNVSTGINPPKEILCEPEECEEDYDYEDRDEHLDQSLGSVRDGGLRVRVPTTGARLSCDETDGNEGFGDEPECTVCQQWFTIWRGKIIAEWWECWEGSDDECRVLMS